MKLWKLLLIAAAAVLVLAACGTAGSDSPVEETSAPPVTESAAADSEAAGMGDMEDTDNMDMEEESHSHGDDDAASAVEWDGGPAPTLDVTVEGDVESGWDLIATVSGFQFSDPTATEHVPGWGHTHVFLDGLLVSMSYEPVVHVDDLDPGPHEVRVTLSRNDHLDYALDGEVISDTQHFEVPGEVVAADAVVTVHYAGGEVSGVDSRVQVATGDLVEITAHSDVAEEVHVHGYDLFGHVTVGQPTTIRFTADVPGIFEVELEESAVLLFELEVR